MRSTEELFEEVQGGSMRSNHLKYVPSVGRTCPNSFKMFLNVLLLCTCSNHSTTRGARPVAEFDLRSGLCD